MSRVIINTETGEMIGNLDEGDRIYRPKDKKPLPDNVVAVPKDEAFTKLYREIAPILAESNMSGAELMVFLFLALNVRYDTNIAMFANVWIINRENIQTKLRLSPKTVQRSVLALIRAGFIYEAKCTANEEQTLTHAFVVNPFIANVGNTTDVDTVQLFRKTKWARW